MKFYTLWLALICIIMFIVQLIFPGFTDALVLNQASWFEPWRFVSSIFLHGGIGHLLYNLLALVMFGLVLEKFVGEKKFLLVFFVSGIIANLIAINFYPSSLGASGAIMGIIGALALIKPNLMVWAIGVPMPLFLASIFWVFGDIAGIFIPDGVGNIAHLAGVGVGLLFGIIFRFKKKQADSSYEYTRVVRIPEPYMRNWEDENIK